MLDTQDKLRVLHGRFRIRGVQDILFYALPEHAHYYSEIVNMLQASALTVPAATHATITTLFCRFDLLALERVVGAARARKMMAATVSTFLYC